MTDIYSVMNIAGKALMNQQKAINVTGNNIANVNTPGYSRQKLIVETSTPLQSGIGPMGDGAEAVRIERVYDRFLGVQINTESEALGQWEAQKDTLGFIEAIFDEGDDFGLNRSLNEFWTAWQDLTNNPSGYNQRVIVQAKSEILVDTFHSMSSDLQNASQGIDANIEGAIEEINRLNREIADLNQKIVDTESAGYRANDYRDKRDLALKELSKMIDVNAFEDASGRLSVSVANGRALLEGDTDWSLSTQMNTSGTLDVLWVDSAGNSVDITSDISGGKMKGWLEVRDVDIANYSGKLDDLVQTLANEVNTLHSNGFGLDGSNGLDFFSGASAADIQIDSAIVNDLNLIAAASTSTGVPGDNTNAIRIANLQHALTMNGNASTFDSYYQSLVSEVGRNVQTTESSYHHQSDMVAQLENQRQSISGVSLDEEMMNLVKFQHAYDSAAKLIATADEMMQTVLNMI
ncbi:MAG: flagellar hook-associated protein FlgK [Desulfobacterales bacterium]|jgi:flagellar hook-associated protein 1 FlgK